ncbi:hypothetical protein PVT67_13245 [Gallaecimonas kandeliae]|uniref:hypothetical protein n=1 Tax=Gallaecimonas kandeliae TaxID=3029055 RepID=UPI002649B4D3|nr:hypothetical protein [Gallaecimonas kandeliae]WKE64628.1 hypothetical protein PVT67_13245 [Gallaecimonas kandeliae]
MDGLSTQGNGFAWAAPPVREPANKGILRFKAASKRTAVFPISPNKKPAEAVFYRPKALANRLPGVLARSNIKMAL